MLYDPEAECSSHEQSDSGGSGDIKDILRTLVAKYVCTTSTTLADTNRLLSMVNCVLDVAGSPHQLETSNQSLVAFFARTSQDMSRKPTEYFFVCKGAGLHGPFSGAPKDFPRLNCLSCSHAVPDLRTFDYFLKRDIATELKALMLKYGHVMSRHQETGNYRLASLQPDEIGLTVGVDGVGLAKTSTAKAVPFFIFVNNLPLTIRKDNPVLGQLFVSQNDIPSDVLMVPLVEDLKNLQENGVQWLRHDNVLITTRFRVVCVVADAPMRAYLQNMLQYNGIFGCSFCKIEAGTVMKARYFAHSPRSEMLNLLRTNEEAVLLGGQASISGNHCQGYRRTSLLSKLPGFDLIRSFVVEPMHCINLGIQRKLLADTWLNKKFKNEGFFLSEARCEAINNRLRSILLPFSKAIPRKPRTLDCIKFYKSSEYATLFDYLIIPVMYGILGQRYLAHIGLLARSSYLLSKKSMTHHDVEAAEHVIDLFSSKTENIYGQTRMTYNLHVLRHLLRAVMTTDQLSNLPPMH
ncbi:hypothetical protein HDE_14292 [Halotydeus destructor]|nr:hypothetical protein HDE_14292 [Halotydeus destructor]